MQKYSSYEFVFAWSTSFLKYICINTDPYKATTGLDGIPMTMDPPRFKIGDLVFAKCTKCKPWPGKIIQIFEDTTFKIDFYNHNSLGIVDLKDLEKVTFATIQKYHKLYEQRKNRDEYLLIEGIKAIEKDFKTRLQIENKEVQKWKNGLPTKAQEQKLQAKLQVEIKKKVLKPSQAKLEQIKQQLSRSKSKSRPGNKSPKEINREDTREPQESAPPSQAKRILRKRKELVVMLKPSPEVVEKQKKSKQKGKKHQQAKKVEEAQKENKAAKKAKKIKKESKKKKDKKKKTSNKKELPQAEKQYNQHIEQLPTQNNLTLLSPSAYPKKQRDNSMPAEQQVTPTEQLNTDQEQEQVSPISNKSEHNYPISAPMATCQRSQFQPVEPSEATSSQNPHKEQQLQIQDRQKVQNPLQAEESSRDVPDISINTSFAFNQTHENIKTLQPSAMIDQKQDLQGIKQSDSSEGKEYMQPLQMAQENKQQVEAQNRLQQYCQQQTGLQNKEIQRQRDCSDLKAEELAHKQENDRASENSDLSLHSSEMKDVINEFDSYVSEPELPANDTAASKQTGQADATSSQELRKTEQVDSLKVVEANGCSIQQQSPPVVSLKPQNQPEVLISDLQIEHQSQREEQLQSEEMKQQRQMEAQPQENPISQSNNKQQADCHQEMVAERQEEAENSQSQSLPSEQAKLLSQLQPSKELTHEIEPLNPVKILMQSTSEDKTLKQKAIFSQTYQIQKIRQEQHNEIAVGREQDERGQSQMKPGQNLEKTHQDIVSKELPNEDEDPVQFQKRYADYSLTREDYCDMVRGLPLLKQQLKAANHKAMARSLVIYLQKLKNLISAPANSYYHHLLQMWKRQLLTGILDSDLLPLEVLIEQSCIDRLLIFTTAFQKSKEAHRSLCHVEYMLSMNRLELYIYRFRKGIKELKVSDYQKSRYAELFQLFEESRLNLD